MKPANPIPYTVDLLAAAKRLLCLGANESTLETLGNAVSEFEQQMPLSSGGEIITARMED